MPGDPEVEAIVRKTLSGANVQKALDNLVELAGDDYTLEDLEGLEATDLVPGVPLLQARKLVAALAPPKDNETDPHVAEPDPRVERPDTAARVQRSRLITLDADAAQEQLVPSVSEASIRANAEAEGEREVVSLAVLGDTNAGKSFLLRKLGALSADQRPAEQHEQSGVGAADSTTDGVSVFATDRLEGDKSFLLDFEGLEGRCPSMLVPFMKRTFPKKSAAQINEMRREAVRKYLPALAMLIGDVVMLVTTGPPVCSRIRDFVAEIAAGTLGRVQDEVKPALVLAYNLQAQEYTQAALQEILPRESAEELPLPSFFSSVDSFAIPFEHAPGFSAAIDALRTGIVKRMQEAAQRRRMAMPAKVWFPMIPMVVEYLVTKRPVHLQAVYDQVMGPQTGSPDKVIASMFSVVYPASACDTSLYVRAVEWAFRELGRFYVLYVLHKRQEVNSDKLESALGDYSAKLWEALRAKAPCEASHSGKGVQEGERKPAKLKCMTRQGGHEAGNGHRTCTAVHMEKGFWKSAGHIAGAIFSFGIWRGKHPAIHVEWEGEYKEPATVAGLSLDKMRAVSRSTAAELKSKSMKEVKMAMSRVFEQSYIKMRALKWVDGVEHKNAVCLRCYKTAALDEPGALWAGDEGSQSAAAAVAEPIPAGAFLLCHDCFREAAPDGANAAGSGSASAARGQ